MVGIVLINMFNDSYRRNIPLTSMVPWFIMSFPK